MASVLEEAGRFGLSPQLDVATGYRLRNLPSFMMRVHKEFYDLYPLHYPVYRAYEAKRRKALRQAFRKWKQRLHQKRASYRKLAASLLEKGLTREEVVNTLMQLGVSRTTD